VLNSFPVLESYITHIRIVEDAAYPSSPPPPNSNPELKKARVIIVAVRKSGHVRMHKARENVNGTFSIGKTWPLDDLSAVESFSGGKPTNIEGEQRKQWAGGVGFIVSVGKPYYWQANTQKEKQFFIASLVKIYTKYTGGKTPDLIGFDDREREQLLGISAAQGRPQLPSSQNSASSHPAPTPTPPYGQGQTMPPRQIPPSREGTPLSREGIPGQLANKELASRSQSQVRPAGVTPSFASQTVKPVIASRKEESPSSSIDYNGITPQQSQGNLRNITGRNQSQDSFNRGDDSNSMPPRSRVGVNGLPGTSGKFNDRSATPTSQRDITPDSSLANGSDASGEVPPVPAPLALPPERRRPPMAAPADLGRARRQESNDSNIPVASEPLRSRRQESNDSMIPAPLKSPTMRREESQGPARSEERSRTPNIEKVPAVISNEENGSRAAANKSNNYDFPLPSSNSRRNESMDKSSTAPVIPSADVPSSNLTGNSSQPPDDDRPGLGPMIKTKKSKAEIASTFRKAAFAANAFKPRAGGAAERLRDQQSKSSEGPDGITSVVPAPSLIRAASNDDARVGTLDSRTNEKPTMPKVNEVIPEVKITVPQSDRPNSVEGPIAASPEKVVPEKAKRETRRQKPTSELTQKHLASLGVDPSILDGKGAEFANLLDEFGWAGEGIRSRNIDQMRDDIERELNTTQAGGWLSRLEEEDDRVEAIKKGLDVCIAECDELDGLLTLYGVELGVSIARPKLDETSR
jgi:hypothetical protein